MDARRLLCLSFLIFRDSVCSDQWLLSLEAVQTSTAFPVFVSNLAPANLIQR
jgi:hypothetical protein